MGVTCNRMLPQARSVTLAPGAASTIFGVGREGVMNGGSNLVITFDGTGDALDGVNATTGVVTLNVFYRATPTSQLVAAGGASPTVAIAGKGQVQVSGPQTSNYEIVVTATIAVPATGPEDIVVSSLTTRAG